MLYQNWWKVLCVILLLYTLVRGIYTPLKPGLVNIEPSRVECGNRIKFQIQGYNTHFESDSKDYNVYIKSPNGYLIRAELIAHESETLMDAWITIPKFAPVNSSLDFYTVIVDHPKHGSSVLPSKLVIKQTVSDTAQGQALWDAPQSVKFHYHKDLNSFPFRNILYETIRNTFFHVSLWFAMFFMLIMALFYSGRYLLKNQIDDDLRSHSLIVAAVLFGTLGIITGSLWAKYTWGTWWTKDIKLNMAALTMLIYFAYLVLRSSIPDRDKKARLSSAYSIFALVAVIPFIFILPRLTDSLHPGNGGNPAFGEDDMDNSLRLVFYPSILGFILLGMWMASLYYRLNKIEQILEEKEGTIH
ncbi:MAG TPA: cytochrome c biogenesis protein CcsA [Saprospiraceae bacterium]|nr:cytochrome c biogenesis protein CcsA [Saprospiraceae bacterium]